MDPTKDDLHASIACGCLSLIIITSLLALIWAIIYAIIRTF